MTHRSDGSIREGNECLSGDDGSTLHQDNSATSIDNAGEIACTFLDKNLPEREYLLIEENQLDGEVLAGTLDLEETDNLGTASRNCGNYTFRIYVK
jgi:hypothetical protein